MFCLHGGDPTLAIFPRPEARTGPRWEHHSGVVDQENHVMTRRRYCITSYNVQVVLVESICLAWVMAFRTTTLYEIITCSPHVQNNLSIKVRMKFMQMQDEKQKRFKANHFVKG